MTPHSILVGLAAGLASGLLFVSLGLAVATPVPVAIASLGWGTLAGFLAALTAGGVVFAATGLPMAGVALLLVFALPTAIAGHLLGLSRPAEDGRPAAGGGERRLDWYPLARVFHALTAMCAAAYVLLGLLASFDPAAMARDLQAILLESGAGTEGLTDQQVLEVARFVAGLWPFIQPSTLLFTLVVAVYAGAFATRLSGRLPRPRDDLPRTARLPRAALLPLVLALLASLLLDGSPGVLASIVAGAYLTAFLMVGLAVFHLRTRGRPGRPLMLIAAYLSLPLLLPLLVFALLGIAETSRSTSPPSAAGA